MNTTMGISVAVNVAGKWHDASAPGASSGSLYLTSTEKDGPFHTVKVKSAGGSAFSAEKIKVTVTLPLLNYAHVLIPDCGRHYVGASKALDIRAAAFRVSAPNAGHPFMALADESGGFLCAFGVVSPTGEVEISRKLPHISSRKAMVGGRSASEPGIRLVQPRGRNQGTKDRPLHGRKMPHMVPCSA